MLYTAYHGTSLSAARAIVADGPANIIGSLRIQEFSARALELVENRAGSHKDLEGAFTAAGVEDDFMRPTAIRDLVDGRRDGLFVYGDFYVALNLVVASSYALCGAEVLNCMRDLRSAVRAVAADADEFLAVYPELWAAVDAEHHPVVLQLDAETEDLLDERTGDTVTEVEMELDDALKGEPGMPRTYRLRRVDTAMVSGYYDLLGWDRDVESFRRGHDDIYRALQPRFRPVTDLFV